jgi:hypothetical protein
MPTEKIMQGDRTEFTIVGTGDQICEARKAIVTGTVDASGATVTRREILETERQARDKAARDAGGRRRLS